MTDLVPILFSVGLVLACGAFVAAEFSFVTVDRGAVDRAAEQGSRRAAGVQTALQRLSTQLSGAQVGITVTNLAIGFLAEPAIADLLREPLERVGIPAGAVTPIAVTVGLVVATAVTMVFGELVPKNLAIARPLRTAEATQAMMRAFTKAMAWPIRGLNGSANILVRALGLEPQEELRSARSSSEIASLISHSAARGTLDRQTAGLMERSVAFGRRTAGEIMTHRVRMTSVDADDTVEAVLDLARTTGHSRFPVVARESDNVVGAVHVKNALAVPYDVRGTRRAGDIMAPPTVVPDTLTLDPLLRLLRAEGFQMAVVADEYGGTAGVVTLEDVVEEIVGDIADEHDPHAPQARQRRDGSWSVSGLLRPDEVAAATGIALPEHEDYDTVAGLFLQAFGRVPEPGDRAVVEVVQRSEADGQRKPDQVALLTVERLDGLRVARLRVEARRAEDDGDE